MASTYKLINEYTVTSATHSVSLSQISQDYTDLLIKYSLRSDYGSTYQEAQFTFNSVTSNYSQQLVVGNGSSYNSYNSTGAAAATWSLVMVGSTATSSTFSNGELYIPNYSSTTLPKTWSTTAVTENNAESAGIWLVSGRNSSTAAITSLTFYAWQSFINFVPGSSFYIYGIKNS